MGAETEINYSQFKPTQRPELHSEAALQRLKEAGHRVTPLPQMLRLPDGRIQDSYPYLRARGFDVIADYYPTWEKEVGSWYSTIMPEGFRGQPGAIVTGGFGDEATEEFEVLNRRADAHNAITKDPLQQIKPYIQIFPWDDIAPSVYPSDSR